MAARCRAQAVVKMILLMAALIGMLAGGAVCVRYLRQEIAGDIGPRLRRLQLQLDNLEAEINLALATRLAELSRRCSHDPAPPDNK
jgi:hypothetical protein